MALARERGQRGLAADRGARREAREARETEKGGAEEGGRCLLLPRRHHAKPEVMVMTMSKSLNDRHARRRRSTR